jgi:hypothetical protein
MIDARGAAAFSRREQILREEPWGCVVVVGTLCSSADREASHWSAMWRFRSAELSNITVLFRMDTFL